VTKVNRMAGLSRSSWYFRAKDPEQDRRHHNAGRPVPGATLNPDGTWILDSTVAMLLAGYRARPEYSNGAGYRKLTKMLRRDHGMFINKKKIYRICDENGLLLEQRSKHSRPLRRIARNREA
jgi:putative transposase